MSTKEWGHYAPFASTSFSNFVQVARQCQLTPAKLDPVSSPNETRASKKEFPWRNRKTSPANFNPRTELCRGSVRDAIASNSTSQDWKTSARKIVQRHCTRRFPTSAKSFIFLTIFFPVFFSTFYVKHCSQDACVSFALCLLVWKNLNYMRKFMSDMMPKARISSH